MIIGLLIAVVLLIGLFAWFLYVNNRDLGDVYQDLAAEEEEEEEKLPVVTEKEPP
ncbi:MAG: hypothetical protein H7836_00975 [Magnetococcus sp. YQC-3]